MKFAILSTIIAVICSCHYVLAQINSVNFKPIKSSPCEGDQGIITLDVVDLDDNQKGFTIDINTPYDLDESVSYKVFVHQVQNGQLRKNVFKHEGENACKDFDKYLGKLWTKIVEACGWDETCPKKAGQFHTDNFPFDSNDVELKSFLYGRFILVLNFEKDGELIVCQEIEFTNSRPGGSVI